MGETPLEVTPFVKARRALDHLETASRQRLSADPSARPDTRESAALDMLVRALEEAGYVIVPRVRIEWMGATPL